MSNETVKERIKGLEVSVDDLKVNHIPHLQAGIDRVEAKTWWILSSVILGFLVSIVLTLWK